MGTHFKNNKVVTELKNKSIYAIACILLPLLSLRAYADIQFREVSREAGIDQRLPTAASSWGDFNGDGWPDIWVSNHHGLAPSLYINQGNGEFVDFSAKILPPGLDADFHGVAWADYDNDGDQDIIAVTGGAAGRGTSPNSLFVNEDGKFVNKAKEMGVDYPLGRGRTPLWLDVNEDGKLDLLLMNRMRQDASSAVFIQTADGFVNKTKEMNFSQVAHTVEESLLTSSKRLLGLNDKPPAFKGIKVNNAFAQLAPLSDKNRLDLIAFMQSTKFYSISSSGLQEFTDEIAVPNISAVEDVAIGDFNGDGKMDMFLVRAISGSKEVVLVNRNIIKGKIGGKTDKINSVTFRTDGDVSFEIHRPWIDPSDARRKVYPKLFIGSLQGELKNEKFAISNTDSSVRSRAPSLKKTGGGISIEFDPITREWALKNLGQLIGFIITSTANIDSFSTKGFKPRVGAKSDVLLLRKGNRFVVRELHFADQVTSCSSVSSGDFDNDMDLDLYLVCAGPTGNLSNILYENDGQGNFGKVKNAGGAVGAYTGRGNQVAIADYNRDGFLDLFITNGSGPPPFSTAGPHQLYQNISNKNNWLEIDLRGVNSNREGTGAKLILTVNGKEQIRQRDGGMHSFSQNHARVHFGMGEYTKADMLTVYWPSGQVQQIEGISANQIIVVEEQATPGR